MHEIKTFGGVEVRSPSGDVKSFRSRKHVGLLIYLRSSPRRVHLRERLVDLFWRSEPSLARHSLSQALYDLRSTLGQVVSNCPGDAVRIEADRLVFDVEELERAVKRGELPKAVDLYSGPFAPDLDRAGTEEFEHWLEGERGRLSVLGQTALRQFLEYADNRGEWGEMCSAALRLIRMNPLDETAHRALMRGLWLHGDQTSALEHFGEVRERLDDELPDGVSQETLELVRRIEGSRPQTFPGAGSAEKVPPLVGRESEVEALAEFADLPDDVSDTLLITGEAGIGKTRLIGELRKLLTLQGHSILQSQCYAAEAEVAYGPVLDGLRDITHNLSDLPGSARYRELGRLFPAVRHDEEEEAVRIPADGQSARRRLFEEIADVLRRYGQERSVVWIIEDIHCIDGASSALLHYLARRLASEPFRLVLTARTDSEQNEAARTLLTDDHFIENSRELTVSPLGREAVEELVEAVRGEEAATPPIVDRIASLSGGNPFYAVELARLSLQSADTLEGEGLFRGHLKTVLQTRLYGLPFESVRILEAVAILGVHAEPQYILDLCGLTWSELSKHFDSLRSRGILKETGRTVFYTHDIMREFVREHVGLVRRSAFHLKAGELLAGNRSVAPSTIARHFKNGGDSLRAFEYAIKAVKTASSQDAFIKAREMAELALNVATTAEEELQALEAYVEATRMAGQLEETRHGLKRILSRLSPSQDTDRWWKYSYALLDVLLDLSLWQPATEHLNTLKSHLQFLPIDSRPEVAELQLGGAELSLAVKSKSDHNIEHVVSGLVAQLRNNAEGLPTKCVFNANYSLAGYAAFYNSARKATAYLQRILQLENELVPEQRIKAQLFLGAIYIKLGDWDKAEHNLAAALKLTGSVHDIVNESAAWNNMGCLHLALGNWREAQNCFGKAIDLQEVSDDTSLSTRLHSDINIANTLFYKGEARKAHLKYKECLKFVDERGLQEFKPEVVACIGLTSLQAADVDTAVQCTRFIEIISEEDLKGIQERYKLDWLKYYMGRRTPYELELSSLGEVANEIESTDVVSSLKLRWLEALIDENETKKSVLSEALQEKGLKWFVGFSRRWLQSAESKTKNGGAGMTSAQGMELLDYAGTL